MSRRLDALAARRLACCTAFVLLSGCVDNLPDLQLAKGEVRTTLARAQTVPHEATVAVASLEGAPDTVQFRFRQSFAKAAAAREITVVDAGAARYLVRGYLSATPGEAGTDVGYVYDIFEAGDHRRVDRVADILTLKDTGAESWTLVDDAVMASLAGRSADQLATALASMPDRVAGEAATPVVTAAQ